MVVQERGNKPSILLLGKTELICLLAVMLLDNSEVELELKISLVG